MTTSKYFLDSPSPPVKAMFWRCWLLWWPDVVAALQSQSFSRYKNWRWEWMLRTCSRPTWRGTSILGAAVGTLEVGIISLENNNQERIIKNNLKVYMSVRWGQPKIRKVCEQFVSWVWREWWWGVMTTSRGRRLNLTRKAARVGCPACCLQRGMISSTSSSVVNWQGIRQPQGSLKM